VEREEAGRQRGALYGDEEMAYRKTSFLCVFTVF
jgi:hypothetical protein